MAESPAIDSGPGNGRNHSLHAISRSAEFLACARTSLRIEQRRHQEVTQKKKYGRDMITRKDDILPLELSDIDHKSLKMYEDNSGAQEDVVQDGDEKGQNDALQALKDTNSLLSLLDTTLSHLSLLVRRRGHTNDPTCEIDACVREFQSYYNDLADVLSNVIPNAAEITLQDGRRSSSQRTKHYQSIVSSLKKESEERMNCFKAAMEQRGEAIKDMTERRQRLFKAHDSEVKMRSFSDSSKCAKGTNDMVVGQNGTVMTSSGKVAAATTSEHPIRRGCDCVVVSSNRTKISLKNQLLSPLFTMTDVESSSMMLSSLAPSSVVKTDNTPFNPSNLLSQKTIGTTLSHNNGNVNSMKEDNNPTYWNSNGVVGYGERGECSDQLGGYGGYYGYSNSSKSVGIRRRGSATTHSSNLQQSYTTESMDTEEDENVCARESIMSTLQKRPLAASTNTRLISAEAAERSLDQLTKVFSNMSTLILSQGEILTRIEDDVEMTLGEVDAGSEEISKLYIMTKSNRGLIMKLFGIMTFLIIFMKIYR